MNDLYLTELEIMNELNTTNENEIDKRLNEEMEEFHKYWGNKKDTVKSVFF